MPIVGDATIVVEADTKQFDQNLRSDVTKSATGVGSIIKGVLGAAVIQQGAQVGISLIKGSIEAARESNAVAAQTAAVIKSTGGAANVAAKDIDNLANSIARKTGIDDEQIAKASNLLLTFTGIRNEAGKNNDIFNQATKIAVDMGKALGTDAAGSAIQLGKALNDPVKGISALTRVGVTFNDEQKKTIENLVKTGKTAEAQKIILAELGREFGGSAEAQATASEKLKVTLGNLQEDLGNKLVPVIDKVATLLADYLPAALDATGKAFSSVSKIIEPVVKGISQAIGVLFKGDFVGGGPFAEDSPFISSLFDLRDKYLPVIKEFATFLSENLKPILIGIGAAALLLAGPFIALGAAFVVAYAKSEEFRDIVNGVVASVTSIIGGLIEYVVTNLPKFQEAFSHVVNAVVDIFTTVLPIILPIVQGVIAAVTAIIQTIVEVIKQVVSFVVNIINGDFGAAFGNLKNIVFTAVGGIIDILRGIVPAILKAGGEAVKAIVGLGVDMMAGLARGVIQGAGKVLSAIKQYVLDKVPGFVKKFFGISSPSKMFAGFGANLMEGMAVGIRGAANSPVAALSAVNGRLLGPDGLTVGGSGGFGGQPASAATAGPLVGQMIIQGATFEGANATAFAAVRELRAEQFRQGK